MWIPDLFMKRVKEEGDWCLFCPDKTPGLSDVYGEEYEQLYIKYEREGKEIKKMKAQDIWKEICVSQKETKHLISVSDAVNHKSNQKISVLSNLVIYVLRLCCILMIERLLSVIYKYCSPSYIEDKFNFDKLYKIARVVCKNLNKVIDRTFYPVMK